VTAAASLSVHPVAAAALGEVAGDVLEQVGPGAGLVVVVAGGAHAASLSSIVDAVANLLRPGALLAIGAPGSFAAGSAAPDGPSLALWGATGVHARSIPAEHLAVGSGSDATDLPEAGTLVVAATTSPTLARLAEVTARHRPALSLVGGLVGPGGRVLLGDRDDETVGGVLLAPDEATAFSAGAVRPVGSPLVVTEAEGPVVSALAGAPAADRLDEMAAGLSPGERRRLGDGLFLCRVVDERAMDPGPGDVVAHAVRGLVAGTRALAVDAAVEVGTLVRFGYLDEAAAHAELGRALSVAAGARTTAGALLFSCATRGAGLFTGDDHDATVSAEVLGTAAVAGAFCAGELAPRGTRSWLTGYTASGVVVHAGGPRALG